VILMLLSLTLLGTVHAGVNEWTAIGPSGGDIASVVIDPQNSNTVFTLADFGLYKSTDSGKSWMEIGADLTGMSSFLTLDPLNTSALYVLTSDGLFKTTDNGANWTPVYSDGNIRTFAIDPQKTRAQFTPRWVRWECPTGECSKPRMGGQPGMKPTLVFQAFRFAGLPLIRKMKAPSTRPTAESY
jgi:hypothetical protein